MSQSPIVKRAGDWMQTASGRQFWPLDPRFDEICIEDIAHSLSMLCRYGGHCRRFYSVAEHSVLMSRAVSPEHALWALLHDASEAYVIDVPRPLKTSLPNYKEIETRVMDAVCTKFGIAQDMPIEVKSADNRILIDEASQNMSAAPAPWNIDGEALGVTLQYWTPERARIEFLEAFKALTLPENKIRFYFEDVGQSCLWWDVSNYGDNVGRVVGAGPEQASIWADGRYFVNLGYPHGVGDKLVFTDNKKENFDLSLFMKHRYRVVRIKRFGEVGGVQ